jgi:hypothetical protein
MAVYGIGATYGGTDKSEEFVKREVAASAITQSVPLDCMPSWRRSKPAT